MNTIIKQENVFHTMWTEELESDFRDHGEN